MEIKPLNTNKMEKFRLFKDHPQKPTDGDDDEGK